MGRKFITTAAFFLIALAAALFGATIAVGVIEDRSRSGISTALIEEGLDWASVEVDGLQVALSGTAPDEATRFDALSTAGRIVDAARVIDRMEVAEAEEIAPPRFSVEILRNDDGISVIGLFPEGADRSRFVTRVENLAGGGIVTDLMETAKFPAPEGWNEAVEFGLAALARLPRSKISISADRLTVTAIATDVATRNKLEDELSAVAPESIPLSLDISAPRPVITPFTFRVVAGGQGVQFDACTAQTEAGLAKIIDAAAGLGVDEVPECEVGIGSPSPDWPDAVSAGIAALAGLGEGSLTFSDTDVSLIAAEGAPRDVFERHVGTLQAALPEGFSLTAVLPEPAETADAEKGPRQFTATRSPEGLVLLRGNVVDERTKAALVSFAEARFGLDHVSDGTRTDGNLPAGWSPRAMAALDALTILQNGAAIVTPEQVAITGVSGQPSARAEIARRLSDSLGEGAKFDIKVRYDRRFDPSLNLPTPENCVERINIALNATKITFAPGSNEIDASARQTLDTVADILKDCEDVDMAMEIGGHTDSQGRESMNQELSQMRAEAVLEALLGRRVLTTNLTAKGYGEEFPIADNGTEDGREENRRIEFKLILPEEPEVAEAGPAEPGSGAAEPATAAAENNGDANTGADGTEGPADEQN